MELRWAINQLSNLNKETGFQVYDLGFPAHLAMSRTLAILKPVMAKIEEHQQELMPTWETNPASVKDEWSTYLGVEVELDLPKFKIAEVKCGGMAPSPEILALLSPIME